MKKRIILLVIFLSFLGIGANKQDELDQTSSSSKDGEFGEICIGTTMDLNGKVIGDVKDAYTGMSIRINKENEMGGINGKKIKFTALDDEFDKETAKKNVDILVNQYKTRILLTPIGAPAVESCLPLIEKEKIAVLFPDATEPSLRKKTYKNLIHLFAPSDYEGRLLMNYAVENLGLKKIAIFYESKILFSKEAFKGIQEILNENNLEEKKDWIAVDISGKSQINGTGSVSEEIIKFNPDAIIFCSLASFTQALLSNIGTDFLSSKVIMGISSLAESFIKNSAKKIKLSL